MPITRDDIIHRIIYNRYKYNIQRAKDIQLGQLISQPWDFYFPPLQHEVHSSSLIEHPDSWPLPSSVILCYIAQAWNLYLPLPKISQDFGSAGLNRGPDNERYQKVLSNSYPILGQTYMFIYCTGDWWLVGSNSYHLLIHLFWIQQPFNNDTFLIKRLNLKN